MIAVLAGHLMGAALSGFAKGAIIAATIVAQFSLNGILGMLVNIVPFSLMLSLYGALLMIPITIFMLPVLIGSSLFMNCNQDRAMLYGSAAGLLIGLPLFLSTYVEFSDIKPIVEILYVKTHLMELALVSVICGGAFGWSLWKFVILPANTDSESTAT